jgi:putative DNA primase/helicase
MNGLPDVADQSDSFYRRLLWVPMTKSFMGEDRKYIKDDYIKRREVLEYCLKRVLVDLPRYHELSVPAASEALLGTYKAFDDPVRAFLDDVARRCKTHVGPSAMGVALLLLHCVVCGLTEPSGISPR